MRREMSAFCEMYGDSLRNRVLEVFLESQHIDVAAGDIARETHISRPKAYELVRELEQKGIVRKSRIVSNTQLYMLNKDSPMAKLLLKSFSACLLLTTQRYQTGQIGKAGLARYPRNADAAYVKER